MTFVLLAANESIGKYMHELEEAGFNFLHTSKGTGIAYIVELCKPQIIAADTELEELNGDKACRSLLEQGIIPRTTFILALANSRNQDKGWAGVCHLFREKGGIDNLGRTIRFSYEQFLKTPDMGRYGG